MIFNKSTNININETFFLHYFLKYFFIRGLFYRKGYSDFIIFYEITWIKV